MINQKRILTVIPARGGSKGLPRKNLRPLNEIPLVAWPIQAALNSRYVDRIIVSTDDPEIAKIAVEYGAEVPFLRPAEYAKDTSPSSEAIIHAIKYCQAHGEMYDYIVLLEPTSPLTDSHDVDSALEILINENSLAIVGVCKVEATHPVYCATIGSDSYLKPFNRETFAKPIRRQDVEELYYFEGSLYISEINKYLETETFYHEQTLPYPVPAWKAHEIDNLLDFLVIETILKNKDLLSTE